MQSCWRDSSENMPECKRRGDGFQCNRAAQVLSAHQARNCTWTTSCRGRPVARQSTAIFNLSGLALFTLLPAGFVGYIPVRVVQAPSVVDVILLAGGAITFLGLAIVVFEYGLRRYASGSWFTTFG